MTAPYFFAFLSLFCTTEFVIFSQSGKLCENQGGRKLNFGIEDKQMLKGGAVNAFK